MITLTRLNGETFSLPIGQIERVEAHPDTTVHLVNGHTHVVAEAMGDVIGAIRAWHVGIHADAIRAAAAPAGDTATT